MTWGAVAIGGGALVGGYISGKGAGDAATQSSDAAKYAADIGNQQYEQTREDMMPWHDAGVNALADYSNYGRSNVDIGLIPESNLPDYDPSGFNIFKDPSYQFRLDEQNRAINRNMASGGKVTSGNRLDEIMRRSGEMASNEWAAADARKVRDYNINMNRENLLYGRGVDDYGRAYGQEGDYLNRLASISNLGNTSTTNMGQFGAANAANAASAAQAAGNAQAAGTIGQANAYSSTLNNLAQGYGMYQASQPQIPYVDNWVSNDPSVWG